MAQREAAGSPNNTRLVRTLFLEFERDIPPVTFTLQGERLGLVAVLPALRRSVEKNHTYL